MSEATNQEEKRTEAPDFECVHVLVGYGDDGVRREAFASRPEFPKLMSQIIGPPLLEGNRIGELLNGDAFFPVMLDLIRRARRSITLETYIWSSGQISDQFIEALSERAKAGVRVHVLGDGLGMLKFRRSDMNRMKENGVQFAFYRRSRWHRVKGNLNHRTHRKLLIVDGRAGVTGGLCIDDRWLGDGRSPDRWRDNGYVLEGPIVNQMQAVFVDNWTETTSQILAGPDYFPDLVPKGAETAQFYHSIPTDHYGSNRLSFFVPMVAAEHIIRIAHSYFVPDDEAIALLVHARRRGVKVEVVMPLLSDTGLGRAVTRSRLGPLLEAGVEVYRFRPAMYHCKYFIVDDLWVTAGSSNFDNRSFAINDEANFNAYSRDFARRQIETFNSDKRQSERYTLEDHRRRPLLMKVADRLVGLFWRVF
jgi:cardiolipin synthase A/B